MSLQPVTCQLTGEHHHEYFRMEEDDFKGFRWELPNYGLHGDDNNVIDGF